jgi:hypothetical protein
VPDSQGSAPGLWKSGKKSTFVVFSINSFLWAFDSLNIIVYNFDKFWGHLGSILRAFGVKFSIFKNFKKIEILTSNDLKIDLKWPQYWPQVTLSDLRKFKPLIRDFFQKNDKSTLLTQPSERWGWALKVGHLNFFSYVCRIESSLPENTFRF